MRKSGLGPLHVFDDLLDAFLLAAHRERGGGAAVAPRGDMAVVNVLPVTDQAIEGAGDNRRRRLLAQLAAGPRTGMRAAPGSWVGRPMPPVEAPGSDAYGGRP